MNEISLVEKIQRHFDNPDKYPLTEHQEQSMHMMRLAWELMLKLHTENSAARKISKTYSVPLATARNHIKYAYSLYSRPQKNEKQIRREIASNFALRMMRKMQKSEQFALSHKFLMAYIKANQLDKEDPVIPDYENINPPDIVTGIDPRLESKIVKLLDAHNATDITKLFDAAENIEFEVVEEVADEA